MKREEAMELVTSGFDELSQALAEGKSDALVTYLSVMARFHDYSFRNCFLIAKQRPSATQVAGFRQWLKVGRQVKKGEKGIGILAPLVYKQKADEAQVEKSTDDPGKVLRGFKVVHVFDVSQTEGDPLPEFEKVRGEPGDWLSRLEHVVKSSDIELEYLESLGGADGVSKGGKIAIVANLPAPQAFLVLVHEYAHELMHRDERRKDRTKKVRETEAEAVGFVVANAIGLDAKSHSSDYIQLYDGDVDTLTESMHRIQQTATRIIEELTVAEMEVQDVA